jgi:hypothetical protein
MEEASSVGEIETNIEQPFLAWLDVQKTWLSDK